MKELQENEKRILITYKNQFSLDKICPPENKSSTDRKDWNETRRNEVSRMTTGEEDVLDFLAFIPKTCGHVNIWAAN